MLFAALLIAGWWSARTRELHAMAAALWTGGAMLLAAGLNQPLVAAVGEARPYTTRSDIRVLAHRSTDLSFPSDHAVMTGATAAGLWLVSRRLGAFAAAAALLMAFSRVYVAAHYPRHVVAGLGLGAAVAVFGCLLLRLPLTALVTRFEGPPLRPVLAVHHRKAIA